MTIPAPGLRRVAAATSMLLALGAVSALPASAASAQNGVQRKGSCSKASDWRLRADPKNGRILVQGEVDSGVKGQHWSWRILHNGGISAHGNAVTKGGGSLEVQRLIINLPGVDSIGWRASNAATGEHCTGNLKY